MSAHIRSTGKGTCWQKASEEDLAIWVGSLVHQDLENAGVKLEDSCENRESNTHYSLVFRSL